MGKLIDCLAIALILLFVVPRAAGAQNATMKQAGTGTRDASGTQRYGVPAEVYYLLPEFRPGMVFFSGQAPAKGSLNICAADNTLRFLDKSGKELVAQDIDNVVKVLVDSICFLHYANEFYRLYPVSPEIGIAVRRDVRIEFDSKNGAYGTSTRTSAVKEYSSVYADGIMYDINGKENYPYTVSERLFIYDGNRILPYSRRNLRKLAKGAKDHFLGQGEPVPEDLPGAMALLGRICGVTRQ